MLLEIVLPRWSWQCVLLHTVHHYRALLTTEKSVLLIFSHLTWGEKDLDVNLCLVFSLMHTARHVVNWLFWKTVRFYYEHFLGIIQGIMILSLQEQVNMLSHVPVKILRIGFQVCTSIKVSDKAESQIPFKGCWDSLMFRDWCSGIITNKSKMSGHRNHYICPGSAQANLHFVHYSTKRSHSRFFYSIKL